MTTKFPVLKPVMRWDRGAKILRLFRLYSNPAGIMDGSRYAWKATVALTPRLFRVKRELDGLIVVVCGLRLHYQRAYGGHYS
jgi:hypothetical protein